MTLPLKLLSLDFRSYISGSGPRESRNHIFKELKNWGGYLFKIEEISISVVWFLKVMCRNGIAPEYLVELFSSNDTIHNVQHL